jgi:AAA domain
VAELDLFALPRGTVTAPAGCGKTQLIVDSLRGWSRSKPVLILTHTNAGVNALRNRLGIGGISSSSYRVGTIDGFSMRLAGRFPLRSGVTVQTLQLSQPRVDYPNIRLAAGQAIHGGHLDDPLRASFAGLIVDEYQDCSIAQHCIIDSIARVLPTSVLGDPMQAIFGFGGNELVDWSNDVIARFPSIGELNTPWRWRNAGTPALGQWLLDARTQLLAARNVDLRTGLSEVIWVPLNAATAAQQRLRAAQTISPIPDGSVVVIGDSRNPNSQRLMASQTPGAIAVEAVDIRDFIDFATSFDPTAHSAASLLVNFAGSLMTNIGAAQLIQRIDTLRRQTARKPPTPAEHHVLAFIEKPTFETAAQALTQLREGANVRLYRPDIYRSTIAAMQAAASGQISFHAAAIREREKYRHLGRSLPRRAVGSTLLLKGLEADVSVLLHPEVMDARHLYVALTRGARRVVVCSEVPILVPVN